MSNKVRKNVIFLIIDSLRFDRLGIGGHTPSPSPTIDALMASNMYLTNTFSVGCPTQFAYPGLITSSLPLDKGGYATGMQNREVTLSEVFKKAGYKTGVFIDDYYPVSAGHTRGFDDAFLLFGLTRFLAYISDVLPYYMNKVQHGEISEADFIKIIEPHLSNLFTDMLAYCQYVQEGIEKKQVLTSLFLYNYDFTAIKKLLLLAQEKLQVDPRKYILSLLNKDKKNVFGQIRSIAEAEHKKWGKINVEKKLWGLFVCTFAMLVRCHLTAKVHQRAFKECLKKLLYRRRVDFRVPSAAYNIDMLMRWIDEIPKDKPFFAWLTTTDVHELNFISYDVINGKRMVKDEVNEIKKLYSDIASYKKGYHGNPLYDYAIKYVDLQIERLVKMLKYRGILDDTLIVLTADHGHTSTEWPIRNDIHIARDFFDELYHVPVAFINKDIPAQKVEGMYSSLDIPTTLLDLLGITIPSCFRGRVASNKVNVCRDYVIMEHLGPGPCDFESKSIKVCVRSKTHKLVYETLPSGKIGKSCVKEIYDLLNDPLEQINLAGYEHFSEPVQKLLVIAEKRVREIQQEGGILT